MKKRWTGRSILVPRTLAEMNKISDRGESSWSSSELIALGESLVPHGIAGATTEIGVIFLNGTFKGNGSILGVHFSGYPFAFVFNDVVTSVGGDGVTQRYVEQATVVHEVGHAVGLVNNGVPMFISHEDSDHPHHTTNEEGVMYWAVESSQNILSFLTNIISGNQLNLFETQSLQDAHAFHP